MAGSTKSDAARTPSKPRGRGGSRDSRVGKGNQRKRRQAHRLRELRAQVMETSIPVHGTDPYEVIQEALENGLGYMRMYQAIVDDLTEDDLWRDTMVGRVPHEAIRALRDVRVEVSQLSAAAIKLGLDERRQRLDEAKVAMLGAAIREAAMRAGLKDSDTRRLGSALRGVLTERLEAAC